MHMVKNKERGGELKKEKSIAKYIELLLLGNHVENVCSTKARVTEFKKSMRGIVQGIGPLQAIQMLYLFL